VEEKKKRDQPEPRTVTALPRVQQHLLKPQTKTAAPENWRESDAQTAFPSDTGVREKEGPSREGGKGGKERPGGVEGAIQIEQSKIRTELYPDCAIKRKLR